MTFHFPGSSSSTSAFYLHMAEFERGSPDPAIAALLQLKDVPSCAEALLSTQRDLDGLMAAAMQLPRALGETLPLKFDRLLKLQSSMVSALNKEPFDARSLELMRGMLRLHQRAVAATTRLLREAPQAQYADLLRRWRALYREGISCVEQLNNLYNGRGSATTFNELICRFDTTDTLVEAERVLIALQGSVQGIRAELGRRRDGMESSRQRATTAAAVTSASASTSTSATASAAEAPPAPLSRKRPHEPDAIPMPRAAPAAVPSPEELYALPLFSLLGLFEAGEAAPQAQDNAPAPLRPAMPLPPPAMAPHRAPPDPSPLEQRSPPGTPHVPMGVVRGGLLPPAALTRPSAGDAGTAVTGQRS